MPLAPMYTDAHLHVLDYITECNSTACGAYRFAYPVAFCCSAHDADEFEKQQACVQELFTGNCQPQHCNEQLLLFSFGIHPQNPIETDGAFLYQLLKAGRIHAIGECGFDLFTDIYRNCLHAQKAVWDLQIRLAASFSIPVVIHCRKALHLIFESVPQLKKIPAVIFHGWGGSVQEAHSLLKKGVNAYFSLGKALLRKQKTVCAMAAQFELERLLTETDAPYMRLNHEAFSHPRDIMHVAASFAALRGIIPDPAASDAAPYSGAFQAFLQHIARNFRTAYGVKDTPQSTTSPQSSGVLNFPHE
ncbi:MAG: TatD family hydrolase [Treponema sp.]